jgi:hypothetical protein
MTQFNLDGCGKSKPSIFFIIKLEPLITDLIVQNKRIVPTEIFLAPQML